MSSHLTLEERDLLAQLHHQDHSQQEIAQRLKRSPATICRELARNRSGADYYAAQAHEQACCRRRERPLTRKMEIPQVNEEVRHGLGQDWSPEQVAASLELQHPADPQRCVTAPTIYRWIEQDEHCDHWRQHLRRRGKRPSRRKKPDGCGAPIKNRPVIIEQRLRLGDLEGDTVLGPPGTGGVVTLACRRSRLTIITKISSKDSTHVKERIALRLKELDDERRHSITFDNGTEFAACDRLEKRFSIQLYLADPGCPYQRGTNENTNGLIRQYFPKGTNFQNISHTAVRRVEELLNNRPRKCLGFRTPNDIFHGKYPLENCDSDL